MKHQRITVDLRVMVGKPVIKGTRITVESILRKLGAGWTIEMIQDAHPRLMPEDVWAAAEFGADAIERFYPPIFTKTAG
jgi:uncharacterized protein (DUF433 family)